eukprot:Partr_v1_DN27374_c0_g1_i1_m46412 putative Sad1 and UNC84 domain containing
MMENRRLRSLRTPAASNSGSVKSKKPQDMTPFRQGVAALEMSPGFSTGPATAIKISELRSRGSKSHAPSKLVFQDPETVNDHCDELYNEDDLIDSSQMYNWQIAAEDCMQDQKENLKPISANIQESFAKSRPIVTKPISEGRLLLRKYFRKSLLIVAVLGMLFLGLRLGSAMFQSQLADVAITEEHDETSASPEKLTFEGAVEAFDATLSDAALSRIDKLETTVQDLKYLLTNLKQLIDSQPAFQEESLALIVKDIVTPLISVPDRPEEYPDYAFSGIGGSVISELTSDTFSAPSSFLSFRRGGSVLNSPKTAISDINSPGNCWPMRGQMGKFTVKLARAVIPAKVSLIHIARQLALDNDISSAPRAFRVSSLTKNGHVLLGDFEYSPPFDQGKQTYTVDSSGLDGPIDSVTLEVLGNYGNSAYTCIYQFQVHA